MGLTIKRVTDEFSSHMTAIQNLYNEAKRDNSIKRASCEAELERTKIKLQETEKKYDDLLQEIRSVFSLVKEKENLSKDVDTTDGSSVGSEDQDDFPAFDDEDDEDEDDDFPADDDDIDEAEWV
mgnify:FL=1